MCNLCNGEPSPKNYSTAAEICAAIATAAQFKSVNLAGMTIRPAIVALVPESLARQYVVFPFALKDRVLYLAISDPREVEKIDLLKYYLNREIQPAVAPREQILEAIDKYYH